ncbi:MAG: hypothetical protein KF678_14880 [Phycisphaeraceae bacterium]|nr:hypothetical protein [Phycisphaeraceae bacterium]
MTTTSSSSWTDRAFRRLRLLAGPAALLAATSGTCAQYVGAPGRIIWWGNTQAAPANMAPPPGVYTTLAVNSSHGLALRPDGTMVGWGANFFGQSTPQPGVYTQVAAGLDHSVALRSDGVAVSWGRNLFGEATTPPGTFVQISAGYSSSAGVRPDGSIHVWGGLGGTPVPPGTYRFVHVGGGGYIGAIRTDGTLVTWGPSLPVIPGEFMSAHFNCISVALRTDGTAVTFGYAQCNPQNYPAPPGTFIQLSQSSGGGFAALRDDGVIVPWGPHHPSVFNVPSGRFSLVAMGPEFGYAIQPCYANCDNSTSGSLLTANDFQCFLNKFAAGDTYANCDGSTGTPSLTANDFQCFLNRFAEGCQ